MVRECYNLSPTTMLCCVVSRVVGERYVSLSISCGTVAILLAPNPHWHGIARFRYALSPCSLSKRRWMMESSASCKSFSATPRRHLY